MIQMVVADDHAIVRDGLRGMIDAQPDMALTAVVADGAALMDVLSRTACDVVVADLSLPHLGGLELVRAICEVHPELAIVVFTMRPEDALALHFLRAGAAAYLSKDRSVDELLAAIRTVAGGGRYLTATLADMALGSSSPGAYGLLPHQSLSARQAEVFERLIQGRSITDIAGELEISGSTASNHVAQLRRKLGVDTVGEILLYAHRVGLLD